MQSKNAKNHCFNTPEYQSSNTSPTVVVLKKNSIFFTRTIKKLLLQKKNLLSQDIFRLDYPIFLMISKSKQTKNQKYYEATFWFVFFPIFTEKQCKLSFG